MMQLNRVFRKISLGFRGLCGLFYKYAVDIKLLEVPALDVKDSHRIVVSLTSYGRRVKTNVLYYTLVSLLRQNVQPDKIIVWLSDEEWNVDTIPAKLKGLKEKGIEIGYCEDIKSYKKLIPTLKKYPQSTIITVDDDVIYSEDTIETLINEHRQHPDDIICLHAAEAYLKDGVPSEYKTWEDLKESKSSYTVFPIGEGGVLYPVGSLHDDVLRSDLFMKLSPLADDIWFWICGLRNERIKRYVKKLKHNYSFDDLYQYFHKGAALTHNNRFENTNDKQFKKILDYYNFKINTEGKIQKCN